MDEREIEERKYDYYNSIADKFKEIQLMGESLQNPENNDKMKVLLVRIRDACDDAFRIYDEIDELDY